MNEKVESPVINMAPKTVTEKVSELGGVTSGAEMKIVEEMAQQHEKDVASQIAAIENTKKTIFQKLFGSEQSRFLKEFKTRTESWKKSGFINSITPKEHLEILRQAEADKFEGTVGFDKEKGEPYYKPSKNVNWNGPVGGAGLGAA